LIINPVAGPARQRDRATALERHARELIPNLKIHHTQGPDHATELARTAAAAGASRVYAAGGDGTVNEVLQGLVGSTTGLCPLPMGTANVACRELRLPAADPIKALNMALKRPDLPATVGLAEGDGFSRHFLLMTGIGIDSAIIADMHGPTKAKLGISAYFLQGLLTCLRYPYDPIHVTIDSGDDGDGGETVSGSSLIIANGSNYAAGVTLVPDAALTSPELCLMAFSGNGPFPYLRYIAGLLLGGRHRTMHGVTVRRGRRFTVHANSATLHRGHTDGELTCPLPLILTALPEAIRLPLPDHLARLI
jgi:diacylglycerol kinase family enzyme